MIYIYAPDVGLGESGEVGTIVGIGVGSMDDAA